MKRFVVLAVGLMATRLLAIDPPHATSTGCADCHILHNSPGANLTTVSGNPNLCLSCHMVGGVASGKRFADANQALPWPGLPAGGSAQGNSHRWDSSAAGHIAYLGGASTGTLLPSGVYTGVYAKVYAITIATAGDVGTAAFNWTATGPGGGAGSNVPVTATVALDAGVSLNFQNGSNTSFRLNDQWMLYVRPGLRNPTNAVLLAHMTNGMVYCSTCHDQHSQARTPFDPDASASYTFGVTSNRHFMVIDNDRHQLCLDCHAARNVSDGQMGSHPVGIAGLTNDVYKMPSLLPLEQGTSNIVCMTCHDVHFTPGNDGKLLRLANSVAVCADCHLLADTNAITAHFDASDSHMLWPGGQQLPARTNAGDQGTCLNCHMVHGWPDAANPTNVYPTLLADRGESLCFTCHGSTGPAVKRVKADFDKTYHHPVSNSDAWRRNGRSVECTDCHNPHMGGDRPSVYTNTATAFRNNISSNAVMLRGVSGVSFNYSGLTNFQVVATNLYGWIPTGIGTNLAVRGATNEYQVCFKCHSGYSFTNMTGYSFTNFNAGTATFTSNSVAVAGVGTSWTSDMIGMSMANVRDSRSYTITGVASSNSLTIYPPYGDADAAGQSYLVRQVTAGMTAFYTNGVVTFTPGSTVVAGSGSTLNRGMVGSWIYATNNPAAAYRITGVNSTNSLTIFPAYQ